MALKICVYLITKNEEKHIANAINSASAADYLYVFDSGSTDSTVDICHREGVTDCIDIRVNPWRFDTARNTALALLPTDIDVCVALDADEVLAPGWRLRYSDTCITGRRGWYSRKLRYTHDKDTIGYTLLMSGYTTTLPTRRKCLPLLTSSSCITIQTSTNPELTTYHCSTWRTLSTPPTSR